MSHATWLHHVIARPVAILASTWVRPNHLTSLRLASGLAAAGCFSASSGAVIALGVVLCFLSIVLDRADGALARIQHSQSKFGHRYDIVCDACVNAALFVGIGVGLERAESTVWPLSACAKHG